MRSEILSGGMRHFAVRRNCMLVGLLHPWNLFRNVGNWLPSYTE